LPCDVCFCDLNGFSFVGVPENEWLEAPQAAVLCHRLPLLTAQFAQSHAAEMPFGDVKRGGALSHAVERGGARPRALGGSLETPRAPHDGSEAGVAEMTAWTAAEGDLGRP